MTNKIVIGIDPGDRYIGVALWHAGSVVLRTFDRTTHTSVSHSVEDVLSYIEAFKNFFTSEGKEVIVVMEKYLNYNHKTQIKGYKQNFTSELIGAFQTACKDLGYQVVMQTASQAKAWTDERLTRLGILTRVGNCMIVANNSVNARTSRHSRDAFRHVIYYLNKNLFDGCITKEDILWHEDN